MVSEGSPVIQVYYPFLTFAVASTDLQLFFDSPCEWGVSTEHSSSCMLDVSTTIDPTHLFVHVSGSPSGQGRGPHSLSSG